MFNATAPEHTCPHDVLPMQSCRQEATKDSGEQAALPVADGGASVAIPCRSSQGGVGTPEQFLDQLAKVQSVLRKKGFSGHAIETAVSHVYDVAMPYVTGVRKRKFENWRAWLFAVAIHAAKRAAVRDVCATTMEPKILAEGMVDPGPDDEDRLGICHALRQLTEQQSKAVDLCDRQGKSQRAAAKEMKISVSTLGKHLAAGKARLREILGPRLARVGFKLGFSAGAPAS